jgi:uncharacterized membrane protein/protein-disulfide isomerase
MLPTFNPIPDNSMARLRHNEIEGTPSPALVLIIRLLLLVALVISAYLASLSLRGGLPVGCGPQSDCDKVLTSRWAYWLGVPVSVFAVVVDLLAFLSTLMLKPKAPAVGQRRAWDILLPCALLLIGAGIWFVSVQVFALQAICPYCMVTHACGAVAGVLLLIAAPIRQMPDRLWDLDLQVFITTRRFQKMVFLALFGVTLLVLGQVWFEPETGRVVSLGGSTNLTPLPAASTQTLAQSTPVVAPASNSFPAQPKSESIPAPMPMPTPASRLHPIYNGQIQVNLSEVPLIGSPTNSHVIVGLFDYTCHHCREMHPRLLEAQQAFADSLVIASLPMPLDPGCNPTMTRHFPAHTNACDYARLGLAVWRADRTKHREFDDWLFRPDHPPPLPEARQFAAHLVGAAAFDNAIQDPWVEQQLRQDVAIYELAYRAQQGSMPQLILSTNVAVGTFLPDQLFKLLENNLGLKKTP